MRRKLHLGLIPAAAVVLAAASIPATPVLSVRDGSRVWVQGTSTVRSWRCEATGVQGRAAAPEGITSVADLAGAVRDAEVSVSVSALDCRNETMNGHMRRALKSAQAPTLRFRPASVRVSPDGSVSMTGPLGIAGQEQAVTIEGTVVREPSGVLRVRGSRQIDMTQWGVQPPSLMMGTMKVNKLATVHFDVVLGG